MAVVVDSIIAELIARDNGYIDVLNKATAAHKRFRDSVPTVDAFGAISPQDAQKYVDRHKRAANDVVAIEEQSAAKVTRARKKRADDAKAADSAEVASAKAAAKAKVDAERAAAREQAQIARQAARDKAAAEKAAAAEAAAIAAKAAQTEENSRRRTIRTYGDNPGLQPARNSRIGATVPNEPHGQAPIPMSVLNGTGEADAIAAESQINHILADRFDLQARLRNASGQQKQDLRDQIEYLRRIETYEKAGLTIAEATMRTEREMALIEAERASTARKKNLAGITSGAEQFTRGAGFYAATGGAAAVAGIGVAAGVAIGSEVIKSATDYGKALSNLSAQLGITTSDLQAYEKIGHDVGVTTEQLTSAFGQFASNLGRAQEGGQEQQKVFKALGVDMRNFASAGDALPTVIDRIGQIADPAKRAAIETKLFGEEGRRLDALLSGSPEKVSQLAQSLQETGQALSAKEIQELDRTAQRLAEVKNQLTVDLAKIVSGNASAIIGLANSFGILADKVLGTIQRLQQFGANRIAQSVFASDGDKAAAHQFLLSSPTGRQQLLAQNYDALHDLYSEKAPKLLVNGVDQSNTPAARAAFKASQDRRAKALIAERTAIIVADRRDSVTPTPAVQGGNINQHLLDTLNSPKGPKGKSAETLAKEADARQKRYEDELARLTDDYLSAQRQLTGNSEERYRLDAAKLKTDYDRRNSDIQREANEKQIDVDKVDELKAANQKAYQEKLAVLALERRVELENKANELRQQGLQTEIELLRAQEALAQTAAERRRLAHTRLDKERAAEADSLNAVINSSDPNVSQTERDKARDRLKSQDARFGAQRAQDDRSTEGPLEQYARQLPRTKDQINEALQQIEVDGLRGLDDALTNTIGKVLHLGGVFGDVANQIISDLIRIAVEKEIVGPLSDALFGNKDGNSGATSSKSGLLSSIAQAIGQSVGKRATGGNVVGGQSYLVGERGPELLTMGGSGRVYPNGSLPALAGRSGVTTVIQHISVDGRNSITPADFADQIIAQANRHANAVAAQAGRTAVEAAPGRVRQIQVLGS